MASPDEVRRAGRDDRRGAQDNSKVNRPLREGDAHSAGDRYQGLLQAFRLPPALQGRQMVIQRGVAKPLEHAPNVLTASRLDQLVIQVNVVDLHIHRVLHGRLQRFRNCGDVDRSALRRLNAIALEEREQRLSVPLLGSPNVLEPSRRAELLKDTRVVRFGVVLVEKRGAQGALLRFTEGADSGARLTPPRSIV